MRQWPASRWSACLRYPDAASSCFRLSDRPGWVHTVCWLFCLLFITLPSIGIAAEISVDTTRHGENFEISATARIQANVAQVWKVLTDYERLPEFIPGLRESRVVSRRGPDVVLEQRGEAGLFFFSYPMHVRLAIKEFPFTRITSTGVSGNFKLLQGDYYLQPTEGGATATLRYQGIFTPDSSFPPVIGSLLVRNTVQKRFIAMVDEMEKNTHRDSARK